MILTFGVNDHHELLYRIVTYYACLQENIDISNTGNVMPSHVTCVDLMVSYEGRCLINSWSILSSSSLLTLFNNRNWHIFAQQIYHILHRITNYMLFSYVTVIKIIFQIGWKKNRNSKIWQWSSDSLKRDPTLAYTLWDPNKMYK